jgi:hypothetical protein
VLDPQTILGQASQGGAQATWQVFTKERGRVRGFLRGTSADPDPLLVITPGGVVEYVDSKHRGLRRLPDPPQRRPAAALIPPALPLTSKRVPGDAAGSLSDRCCIAATSGPPREMPMFAGCR